MERDEFSIDNNNNRDGKKTAIKSKMDGRFIISLTLTTLVLTLAIILAVSTYPVQATGGSNETAATLAPGGASVGPAGSGTNVTQSDCLSQDNTTTERPAVATGDATATTANNTTTATVAPGGASIGANDTSTSNATRGNITGNTTTNNTTTTTFAPSGASIC
jgi:hypothetical protein